MGRSWSGKGSGASSGWLASGGLAAPSQMAAGTATHLADNQSTSNGQMCCLRLPQGREKGQTQLTVQRETGPIKGINRNGNDHHTSLCSACLLSSLSVFPLSFTLSPFISLLFFFSSFVSAGSLTNHLVGVAQSLTCVCGQHYPQRLRYYWL